MSVESTISKELDFIERSEGVKILFDVESGSRSWGFASPDSDFDVRFVYARRIRDYLALNEPRDVIEHAMKAENIGLDVDFDAAGWDLRKFLRLMRNSNPSSFEWLGSKTVYREDSSWCVVRKLSESCFEPRSVGYHYLGMLKNHDRKYLGAEKVAPKKYLYCIRAILAARWAVTRFKPVPVPFDELKEAVLEPEMMPVVEHLLEIKASSDEKCPISHIPSIDMWLNESYAELQGAVASLRKHPKCDWCDLDDVFLELVNY